MSDFLRRQFVILREAEAGYVYHAIGLNQLVNRIEAAGRVVGGELWESIFDIVLDLELINSEVIDKQRALTVVEQGAVLSALTKLNSIISQKEVELK